MKKKNFTVIKFPQGLFGFLTSNLLRDKENESFAVLLGKHERADGIDLIRVVDIRIPTSNDFRGRGLTHLNLESSFVFDLIQETVERLDVDSIVDVHTHPFCKSGVSFSGVDDSDETNFGNFLHDRFDNLHYGSIVLSRSDYSARIWRVEGKTQRHSPALIKTPTPLESWPSSSRSYEARQEKKKGRAFYRKG
jgi:molybdopterin-synthase adenylyltransferase